MTNAEARFNKSLRPRKPEGSLGPTAQDVHHDCHTAPELCINDVQLLTCYWCVYSSYLMVVCRYNVQYWLVICFFLFFSYLSLVMMYYGCYICLFLGVFIKFRNFSFVKFDKLHSFCVQTFRLYNFYFCVLLRISARQSAAVLNRFSSVRDRITRLVT